MLFEAAYLTAWTVVSPWEQETVTDSAESEDHHFCRSDNDDIWWGVFIGYKVFLQKL